MNRNAIPKDLRTIIGSEPTDFIVKSKKNFPRRKGLTLLAFAGFWNVFISIFVIAFIVPIIQGKEVHFKQNDIPVTGSLENWETILVPSLIIGLFVVVGIFLLIAAIVQLLQKGGYFVGTPTRFIKYRRGNTTIKDWEQFSGNMRVSNKGNYGNIEMELRTGKMKRGKNKSEQFVPDIIYISQINKVFDIEQKCRKRIKENDPTPSRSLDQSDLNN
ncbi:hypothetical protein [Zhouia amylolytica]|uniref:DUF304 domain-containing protein n=1 Tax=Zhouia amylolytica AD3 TaxID=1286632 RepID=W2UU18_9FLAO|nr:hypothetical protein [Zhouia amylolytica]ETN96817.1 hypothetical protein P278_02430 [Zhouia amylolytica AD3]MCQ0111165.1 hypothetical protein [Zhouia amylolytica]